MIRAVFLLFFLFLACPMRAQNSPTLAYLKSQQSALHFAEQLLKQFPTTETDWEVSFDYSFLTIAVREQASKENILYVRLSERFNMLEVWHKDANKIPTVRAWVEANKAGKPDDSALWALCHTEKMRQRLACGDAVGKLGTGHGTSYENSYYNQIKLTKEGIFLQQIDEHNATLLGAKSYNMRRLYMFAPFGDLQASHRETFIRSANAFEYGQKDGLLLSFSDFSTDRTAGEAMQAKIKELGFETER